MEALKEQIDRAAAGEEVQIPRWVRINTIKTTVEEQLDTTFKGYEQVTTIEEVLAPSTTPTGGKLRRILIDPHIPNLVAITQGIDLSKTEAYSSGKIIFQDKASCFPAYLLDPLPEDGDVIDGCAAPGNKTTHLAAICHTRRPDFETQDSQKIFAFEKDKRRSQTLTKMVKIAGSQGWTKVGFGQDFCQVDSAGEQFAKVGALLLDPSCSGSGIVGRDTMPELHVPEAASTGGGSKKIDKGKGKASQEKEHKGKKRKLDKNEAAQNNVMIDDDGTETVVNSEKDLEARLQALAGFQLKILLHALTFPAAKKVTYSTCSIHSQENEHVVMKVLQSEVAQRRGWRIMKRSEQVRGMRDWPVRGLKESCGGDAEVADGCIRSYKGDGYGVMGFFVAGFVRDGNKDEEMDPDGPYMRDERGMIIRDVSGMPYLKTTGKPVELLPRDESEVEDEEEEEGEMDEDGPYVRDEKTGMIIRDENGMPFLKRKSKPGELATIKESEDEDEDESDDDESDEDEDDDESEEGDDWKGFED